MYKTSLTILVCFHISCCDLLSQTFSSFFTIVEGHTYQKLHGDVLCVFMMIGYYRGVLGTSSLWTLGYFASYFKAFGGECIVSNTEIRWHHLYSMKILSCQNTVNIYMYNYAYRWFYQLQIKIYVLLTVNIFLN